MILHVILILSCCLSQTRSEIPPEFDGVSVRVSSPKEFYFLGEPILLDVAAMNNSENDIKILAVFAWNLESSRTLFSFDNISYKKISFRSDHSFFHHPKRILEARKRWTYKISALNSSPDVYGDQFHLKCNHDLIFDKPGYYYIKVNFPIYDVSGWPAIESNPVRVLVRQPDGPDYQVWKKIQKREMLCFLRSPEIHSRSLKQTKENAANFAEILREFPNTRYRPTIHNALRIYYATLPSSEEREQFRVLLGISKEVDAFFPGDERLDIDVIANFASKTTLENVAKWISEQSGIYFSVSKTMRPRIFGPIEGKVNLRQLMQTIAKNCDGVWVSPDDEYLLYSSREPR